MNTKKLGSLGEKVTLKYLKDKGYEILDRNYSSKFVSGPQRGEIDIVAKPGRKLFDILWGKPRTRTPKDPALLQKGGATGQASLVRGKQDDIIHFIEVKTMFSKNTKNPRSRISRQNGFSPEEKVNFQKQRKILKMAENWLMEKKIPLDSPWQVDVISVKIDLSSKKAKIRHFQNAVY